MPDPAGMAPASAVKVPRVLARPQPWLLAFLIACIIAAALLTTGAAAASPLVPPAPLAPASAAAPAAARPSWEVGECVAGTDLYVPTDCSAAHVGRIVGEVTTQTFCPTVADSFVTFEGKILCIDHVQ